MKDYLALRSAPAASSVGGDHPLVQAVILAGAHSWGGHVLERVSTRPLLPIVGRPMIAHTLSWLRGGGISETRLCANSDTPVLWRRLGDGGSLGMDLEYYEDVSPRGPAGCVRDAVLGSEADLFVVVEGTILPQIGLADLLDAHQRSEAMVTIVVEKNNNDGVEPHPHRAGKPVGIYVFSRSALQHIPAAGYQDIKESLLPKLHAQGERVLTFEVDRHCAPRVTGVGAYLAICKWAVERLVHVGEASPAYERRGEALVHETASVDPSARLLGPVLIEPNAVVGAGAIVVGPTTVGEGSRLEQGVVVSRSVIWSHCTIGRGASLDHCVVTHGASVEANRVNDSAVLVAGNEENTAKGAGANGASDPTARTSSGARRNADHAAGAAHQQLGTRRPQLDLLPQRQVATTEGE